MRVEHIWSDRFDKEREQFVADRKMDTKRAKAKTPVAWNYVSFDEAIALGKKANKPVFIDVMAFWCVWCYRMDYYTYCDAQVAEVRNTKFVPCKIIQEQAKAGDYDMLMKEKLKARGIPDRDSRRLIATGFVEDVIAKLDCAPLIAHLDERIEAKFARMT